MSKRQIRVERVMASLPMLVRKYQFETLLPGSKADIVEKSVGVLVPFPSWMTQKVSQKLGGKDVLGLVGAAGSVKMYSQGLIHFPTGACQTLL